MINFEWNGKEEEAKMIKKRPFGSSIHTKQPTNTKRPFWGRKSISVQNKKTIKARNNTQTFEWELELDRRKQM